MIIKPGQPGNPGQGGRVTPKPEPIRNGGKIGDIHRDTPKQQPNPSGAPAGKPVTRAPQQTTVINKTINNTTVVNNITNVYNRTEVRRGGYWWHDYDGMRYCHYYDGWGYHWYGWWWGDYYYWTRWYYGYFWWYDPYWHRWCYWRDGYWWWQSPDQVEIIYIYRDGSYYEYREGRGGVIIVPDPTPPVETPPADPSPAPAPDSKSYYSNDGTRTVQVSGDNKDAYLYDTADPPAFEPKYLASGVNEVRFKLDSDGKLLQILALTDDGSFSTFDRDGNPVDVGQFGPAEIGGDPASVDAGFAKSPLFGALKSGAINW